MDKKKCFSILKHVPNCVYNAKSPHSSEQQSILVLRGTVSLVWKPCIWKPCRQLEVIPERKVKRAKLQTAYTSQNTFPNMQLKLSNSLVKPFISFANCSAYGTFWSESARLAASDFFFNNLDAMSRPFAKGVTGSSALGLRGLLAFGSSPSWCTGVCGAELGVVGLCTGVALTRTRAGGAAAGGLLQKGRLKHK